MSELTLQQVAEDTGIRYDLIKKHAQRGKLRTFREGDRVFVSEGDLAAYLATEAMGRAVEAATGEPVENVVLQLRNAIVALPAPIKGAVLMGLPRKA